jgi:hypothetical protein
VSLSFPGSECPDPIPVPVSTSGYTEYAQFLSSGCAPDTAEKMQGLTLIYTVTCSASHGGFTYTGCNTGQATNTYAFLDAITLDLEYELGGEGGTPIASFVAKSGGTTVSANATFGDGTSVTDYRVS